MIQRAAASAPPPRTHALTPALTTSASTSSLAHASAFPVHAVAKAVSALIGKDMPAGTAI
ncbi:hypothetical protein [Hyphomonas adhaerens]|uniref:hypothetical protein n=1 Tax=Hyphomonas adhaerens TaxID=81029 RepID=UPI0006906C33|nr:hypothetical protein [Hyphomonas adhaerens]